MGGNLLEWGCLFETSSIKVKYTVSTQNLLLFTIPLKYHLQQLPILVAILPVRTIQKYAHPVHQVKLYSNSVILSNLSLRCVYF